MEWFLEKATEIGIDEITPIICDNSERKIIKEERFQKIIQSAMKQSLQAHLPILNPAISFNQFVNQSLNGKKLIAHCEDEQKTPLKSVVQGYQSFIILIGPEGDFTHKEINSAIQMDFTPISLGDNRLRTETAGIAACHTISLFTE